MLFGFLVVLFTISCLLLIMMILIQQGKGNMGLGSMGGGTQMLFGGSGGQDIFQKITWVLGAIFMIGSLVLALMKTKTETKTRFIGKASVAQQHVPTKSQAPQKTE